MFYLCYNKPGLKITASAREQLRAHSWPGNIRELEHALENAVILSENKVISSFSFSSGAPGQGKHGSPAGLNLEEHEKAIIEKAMREVRGNISAAAKALGINRSTLYQKIKKYGI